MIRTIRILAALTALAMSCAGVQAALDVGDPAPPLTITEWVQGAPVDFKKDLGRKTYMVEFWAVWCPPCKFSVPLLSRIQSKFRDDLVIIGVTAPDFRGNTPTAIRQFVKQQGRDMNYTVAIDRNMRTTDAYMTASQVLGIPHAFLIDKTGKIVWQGSPLEPELEEIVSQIIAGTYDVSAAKAKAKADRLLEGLFPAMQTGQWKTFWDGLLEVVRVDPGHKEGLNLIVSMYVDQLDDGSGFRSWCKGHIAEHRGSARAMLHLATSLCNHNRLAFRTPDLALEAAKAAYEAAQGSNVPAIEMYARAQYQIGYLDGAINVQREAVAAATGDQRVQAQAVLDFYKKCRALRADLK